MGGRNPSVPSPLVTDALILTTNLLSSLYQNSNLLL